MKPRNYENGQEKLKKPKRERASVLMYFIKTVMYTILLCSCLCGNALETKWRVDTPSHVVDVVEEDSLNPEAVFISCYNGFVAKHSLESGDRIWSFKDKGIMNICAYRNKLYTSNGNQKLLQIDPQNGEIIWKGKIFAGTSVSPAAYKGMIYIGGIGGVVTSVDVSCNEIKWFHDTKAIIRASPEVNKKCDEIYIANYSGNVFSFSMEGDVRWRFKSVGQIQFSPVATDADEVVFTDGRGAACLSVQRRRFVVEKTISRKQPMHTNRRKRRLCLLYF